MAADLPFILVVTLPFAGALLVSITKGLGDRVSSYLSVAIGCVTAVISIAAIPKVHSGYGAFGLLVDGLGYSVALASSVLGSVVLLYSLGYMAHESDRPRYYSLVLLTIGSVNAFALSGNILAMVPSWAFCSFLTCRLIGFNRNNPDAPSCARRALAFGRAGDALLILGLGLLYFASGAKGFGLREIAGGISAGKDSLLTILSAYAILLAAMVRSAQIPLHVWLPGAMEAPSSASALLDAATVMNIGVYIVMRLYPIYRNVPAWTGAVLWTGAVTILLSALMALYAGDLKKMLAYSTMSQLGYMFFAVGVGSLLGAQFHLMSHAIFKTLLFLAAGAIVHATGTRDMDLLSGAGAKMPLTKVVSAVGVMGLSGVPFMSGFFSKDMILAGALQKHEYTALVLAGLGAVLTVVYSWSAYIKVFHGTVSRAVQSAREAPLSMEIPMVILALLTPFFWLAIGVESRQLAHAVPGMGIHTVSPLYLVEETFASVAFLISVAALVIGLALVRRRQRVRTWMEAHAAGLVSACRQGFYFERLFATPSRPRGERKHPLRRA